MQEIIVQKRHGEIKAERKGREMRKRKGGGSLKLHFVGGNRRKRFQYQYQIVLKKVDSRIPVVPRLTSGHLAGEACHEKVR